MGSSKEQRRRWRTVVESPFFQTAARQIEPNARRLDTILDGVKEVVARHAEGFHQIPNTPLRYLRTRPFPGAPALRIVFTIDDDDHVTFQHIGLIPENSLADDELDELDELSGGEPDDES